jgi:small conductance mechanosensitive channel
MSQLARRVARPHVIRAAAAAVVALTALVVASREVARLPGTGKGLADLYSEGGVTGSDIAAGIAVVVFVVAGIYAVRCIVRGANRAMEAKLGEARGTPLELIISIVGYLTILLPFLNLLGIDLGGLLLGGALTGIVIGIAAQQTLGNFIAGMVLLFVRPFSVGDHLVLRSGPLGGEYEGTVVDMGFFYMDMTTDRGPVKLPNAGVLASAIGPGAKAPQSREDVKEE